LMSWRDMHLSKLYILITQLAGNHGNRVCFISELLNLTGSEPRFHALPVVVCASRWYIQFNLPYAVSY